MHVPEDSVKPSPQDAIQVPEPYLIGKSSLQRIHRDFASSYPSSWQVLQVGSHFVHKPLRPPKSDVYPSGHFTEPSGSCMPSESGSVVSSSVGSDTGSDSPVASSVASNTG